jgi:O-succinylbenzoic acid--CoA ligase
MVPAQLQRLIDAAETDVEVLQALRLFRAILVGGQAIPQAMVQEADRLGIRIIRTYGSAETAGGCVWEGVPLAGVGVEEIDGRLAISGAQLAGGYLDDDPLTAQHFIWREGTRWYLTDDQGVIENGAVGIVGRVDDVIISGGKKVSLAEIERIVVDELGGVGCVVVACPHEEWGQAPVIVGPVAIDVELARDIIGQRLGPHARPDRFVVVDPLPTLASGKPDRVGLTLLVSP